MTGLLIYLILGVRIIHCNGEVYIPESPCLRTPAPSACITLHQRAVCR